MEEKRIREKRGEEEILKIMNKEKCEVEWILENKGNKLGSSRKIEK